MRFRRGVHLYSTSQMSMVITMTIGLIIGIAAGSKGGIVALSDVTKDADSLDDILHQRRILITKYEVRQ